jgi:hypothetical protein
LLVACFPRFLRVRDFDLQFWISEGLRKLGVLVVGCWLLVVLRYMYGLYKGFMQGTGSRGMIHQAHVMAVGSNKHYQRIQNNDPLSALLQLKSQPISSRSY